MDNTSGWFGVRCLFKMSSDDGESVYEERVTIWTAADAEAAIGLAETEAADYAALIDADYLGLAQAYTMDDEPIAGAEVFSLMRSSALEPTEYLNSHFSTGAERQTHIGVEGTGLSPESA